MSAAQKIEELVKIKEGQKRVALSSRYPILVGPILFLRRSVNKSKNLLNFKIARQKKEIIYDKIVARHQSVLIRQLGDSEMRLQEQKVTNLRMAAKSLNGLIIKPGEIFSLWEAIGKPTKARGYVGGMLLSNGRVMEGIGGGLCQLSNLLFWLFMHAPIEVIERYHHSMDVFPDSGRTLPFGSGATIHYNSVDLKIKNISKVPWQIKIWVTDKYLKVQLLALEHLETKFHIKEENHFFVKSQNKYYRYNELWREESQDGKLLKKEKFLSNFAPVLYDIDDDYLKKLDYKLLDLDRSNL